MSLRSFPCLLGALLLTVSAGCAGAGDKEQVPPRVLAVYDIRLTVRADSSAPGNARLLVLREWTRELERDALAPGGPAGIQVASVGFSGGPNAAFCQGVLYAIGELLWVTIELVKVTFGWMIPEQGPVEVIRFQETLREPVLRATIEPGIGGPAVDLGVQPMDGYWLDDALMGMLGGPGATVTIRDQGLFATVRLPGQR